MERVFKMNYHTARSGNERCQHNSPRNSVPVVSRGRKDWIPGSNSQWQPKASCKGFLLFLDVHLFWKDVVLPITKFSLLDIESGKALHKKLGILGNFLCNRNHYISSEINIIY